MCVNLHFFWRKREKDSSKIRARGRGSIRAVKQIFCFKSFYMRPCLNSQVYWERGM